MLVKAFVVRRSPQIFPSCSSHVLANLYRYSWKARSRRVLLIAGTTVKGTETQVVSIALAMMRGVSCTNAAPAVWLIVNAEEEPTPNKRRKARTTSHEPPLKSTINHLNITWLRGKTGFRRRFYPIFLTNTAPFPKAGSSPFYDLNTSLTGDN